MQIEDTFFEFNKTNDNKTKTIRGDISYQYKTEIGDTSMRKRVPPPRYNTMKRSSKKEKEKDVKKPFHEPIPLSERYLKPEDWMINGNIYRKPSYINENFVKRARIKIEYKN